MMNTHYRHLKLFMLKSLASFENLYLYNVDFVSSQFTSLQTNLHICRLIKYLLAFINMNHVIFLNIVCVFKDYRQVSSVATSFTVQ